MSRRSDEEILDLLGQALATDEAVAPSLGELSRFRRMLALHPSSRPRRRIASLRRPMTAFLVVCVGVGGSAVGAAAAGSPLPRPLRSAAVAIGLPVDDVPVAAFKSDAGHLRDALNHGNGTAAAAAASDLRSEVSRLGKADRSAMQPVADSLLRRSDQFAGSIRGARPSTTNAAGSATRPGGSERDNAEKPQTADKASTSTEASRHDETTTTTPDRGGGTDASPGSTPPGD
jgi:hypothetical protein